MPPSPADHVRDDYNRIAAEYARRLFRELEGKPSDRELLPRFAADVKGRGSGPTPECCASWMTDPSGPVKREL
jgi:hypothetical protein